MSMHTRMKKEEFLKVAAEMKAPRVKTLHVRVLLCDGERFVEVYCASNWREESYGAARNAWCKYNKWLKEANLA